MARIRVTVAVEGEQLDVAALVQDHLERNLRFKTVGPTCEECREMEARSDRGEEFDAPPLHPHCDCRLVLKDDDDRDTT